MMMVRDHDVLESRLIDLAAGLLTEDKARETMEHVRGCSTCEERLREIVADVESARALGRPRMVGGQIKMVSRSRRSWAAPRVVIAAAVLALVMAGAFYFTQRDNGPEYWIPVTDEAVVLRSQNGKSGVADVLRSYQEHDVESAIEDLQALQLPPGDNTASTLRDLYVASALINAGRANEGLEVLDRHDIQSMPTPWRYEAEWVKYIGLRRAGRDDEAQSWLGKLSAGPGPNSPRVQAELKQRSD